MIGSAMAYAFVVAALLSVAALAFERICALGQWPRRFVWLAALLASLVLPCVSMLLYERAAPAVVAIGHATPARSIETTTLRASIEPTPATATRASFNWPDAPKLDVWLLGAWALASAVALIAMTAGFVRLRRLRGTWNEAEHDGQRVWWSDRVGPAVIGWWRPEIVVPYSLRDSAGGAYSFVMAHEQGHIAARDPLLLFAARLLVAIAPWNLPLWWQLRRLRFAIEVDCDARVLAQGCDPVAYGHTLLSIAEQRAHIPLPAIALTEPASQLEKRIRIMTTEKPTRFLFPVTLFATLSLSFVVCATQMTAPAGSFGGSDSSAVDLLIPPSPLPDETRQHQKNVRAVDALQALVRQKYPQLWKGDFSGLPVVLVLFGRNGEVERSSYEMTDGTGMARGYSSYSLDPLGVRADLVGYVQGESLRTPSGGKEIFVRYGERANATNDYRYFEWAIDPISAETRANLEKHLLTRYFPDVMKAHVSQGAAVGHLRHQRKSARHRTGGN